MSERPFFTVVMATYDRGQSILPSVRSVLAQDWPAFELIVVGDGCTDETEAVLSAIPDTRLRWMTLPLRMGNQTWPNNAGIAAARGSHIAYLGHDDLWEPDHLSRMAAVFSARADVAFVASGCALHNPKGMPGPFVTGLFEEPGAERIHFTPPSSFSHLRSVIGLIGPWRDPDTVRAPVDSDLLLRAVAAGLSFATTGAITVHKFAAGHRYLSYLWHDTVEQDAVMARLSQPGVADWHSELIAASKAADMYMTIRFADFSVFEPGQIIRENLARKGVRMAHDRLTAEVVIRPGPMDWNQDWAPHPDHGIRWSVGNARPRVLLPVSGDRAVLVAEFAHATPGALAHVVGQANGENVTFRMSPPIMQMGRWTAMGRAEVTLRQDRPSALELALEGAQAPVPGQGGLGHGRLVLMPAVNASDRQAAAELNAEGAACHARGDVAGAVAAFQAALAASPLHATARGNLALLLAGDAAVDQALTCIGLEPGHLPGWLVLARAALSARAFDGAQCIAAILDGLPGGAALAHDLRAAIPD